jgi:hypothetical protein
VKPDMGREIVKVEFNHPLDERDWEDAIYQLNWLVKKLQGGECRTLNSVVSHERAVIDGA